MFNFRAHLAMAVLAGVVCISGNSQAAKAPHIPGIVDEGTIALPIIQNISSGPIVVGKEQYVNNEYGAIFTTLTLELIQDSRGKVTGSAALDTNHPAGDHVFAVTGKIKATKTGPGFKLKGFAEVDVNGKTKKAKLSINAVQVGFQSYLDVPMPNFDDPRSTATYSVDVKSNGTGFNFSWSQLMNVVAIHSIGFQLAPLEVWYGLKDKPDSDYYRLFTPWGTSLADGSVQEIDGNAVFTLKAPRFSYVETDFDWNGSYFDPEYLMIKTPIGKWEGQVQLIDPAAAVSSTSARNEAPGGGYRRAH